MLLALAELSFFGRDYAEQVVRNARRLAVDLAEEGFSVSGEQFGPRSHIRSTSSSAAPRGPWRA